MCLQMIPALGFGAGATATGATAAAATATTASTLQTIGLIASVGGSIYSGLQANKAAKEQAAMIQEQRENEAKINATEDHRTRLKFMSQIRRQFAELAARGVSLDSPTAVMLGQTAAQEMAFASQAVRAGGQAKDAELSNSQRILRAQGTEALFKGGLSAVGKFLKGAPDVWPELLA